MVSSDLEADPWAWIAQEPTGGVRADVAELEVTAVLVAFDAARWLPGTLAALAALTTRPTRLIAVDNGSADATLELLEQARAQGLVDAVYRGRRGTGFGAAVATALAKDRPPARRTREDQRWLWLLHDDAEPAPDALHHLLAHVTADPGIDVTGPKLVLPRWRPRGHQLSEVGVTISGTGRRELHLEPGEIDQGQRDHPQERLGVSTCGMLVRADVWRDLDGLEPAVPVFRDGVEFGWRAHLAGYRVVTTPSAEVTHRQVGRAGLRSRGVAGRRPTALDRQLGLVVVAGHASRAALPLVWVRLVLSCLVRAAGYLLGKAPGRALDELVALRRFVRYPDRLRALRRRTAAVHRAPGTSAVVRALRPPWWASLRLAGEALSGALSERYRSVAGELDSASLDELTGDDFSATAAEVPRRPWLRPGVLVLAAALLGSLVAARSLLSRGALVAPALLPADARLRDVWSAATAAIPGAPGQVAPPWLFLTAFGSTLTAGRPAWFVAALVCGVVPLTLLSAYALVSRVIATRRLRLWVAGTYALLPVLLGATNQGRLSLCVASVALPLLGVSVRALATRRVHGAEAWRGGWATGVVLALVVAFEPALMLVALVLAVVGAFALRRSPRKVGRIGIAVGLPLVVWLPWWPSLILAPGRLVVGPDAALDGAPPAPEVWSLLLGRGLGPGLPPFWLSALVTGVVWAVAVVGLLRRPRRRAVLVGWVTALVSLAAAVVLSRLVVPVPPVGTPVRPWVGVVVLLTLGGLLVAAGAGLDGLGRELAARSFGWVQPLSVVAGALAVTVTVVGAAWWVWAGAGGPVRTRATDVLPPYLRLAMTSDAHVRVLAVEVPPGSSTTSPAGPAAARYSVLADRGVHLGDADRGLTFGGSLAARDIAADVVARLVAGTADERIAPQLADLGIGYVWVLGLDEAGQARVANTPGLGAASGNARGTVWQVEPGATRAALAQGDVRTALPGPPATVAPVDTDGPRVLQTGEALDPRWRAHAGTMQLAPVAAGWQQGFVVPAGGGEVTWTLPSAQPALLVAEALVLAAAALIAAPGIRRPDVLDPTRTARRTATLAEVR